MHPDLCDVLVELGHTSTAVAMLVVGNSLAAMDKSGLVLAQREVFIRQKQQLCARVLGDYVLQPMASHKSSEESQRSYY